MNDDRPAGPARLVEAAAVTIGIVLLTLPLVMICLYDRADFSLQMVDGTFQTYAAVRALAAGEAIGGQTQVYLGVLMPLSLVPLHLAFGGSPFASKLAADIGCYGGTLVTAWLLLKYAGVHSRSLRLYCLAICLVLVTLSQPGLLLSGYSLRPYRWALAGIVAGAATPACGRLLAACRQGRWWQALAWSGLLGGVGGLALLWANDTGLPCLASLFAALAMLLLPCGWKRGLACVGAFAVAALLVAAAVATILAHGDPLEWARYTFLIIPGNQFWYFGPWDRGHRIFGFADIGLLFTRGPENTAFLVLLAASCLVLMANLIRRRGEAEPQIGLFLIGCAALGGALLPQVGGHVDGAYMLGIRLPGAILPIALLAKSLRTRGLLRLPSVSLVHGVAAIMALASLVPVDLALLGALRSAWQKDNMLFTPLGARIPREAAADLQWLVRYGERAEAVGIAPNRRVFAEYVSPASIAAGALPVSRYAMLIHVLGERARQEYLRAFEAAAPPLAVTVNPAFSGWANWNLRTSWYLFRPLMEEYEPFARTDGQIVWRRRGPRPIEAVSASCLVHQVTGSLASISIAAQEDEQSPSRTPDLVEIRLALDMAPPAWRWMLVAREVDTPLSRSVERAGERWMFFPNYGLPPRPDQTLVTEIDAHAPSVLEIELMPGGGHLAVKSCTAVRLMPNPLGLDLPPLHDLPVEVPK